MSEVKRSPAVGVVIPVYCRSDEHEAYLEETLGSVAGQTFKDFEVIIVDDVSPRDVRPIISRVSGLPGVNLIRNEANLGHARSRNAGVLATDAEFVAFIDHDDLWAPEKLERQVAELRAAPEAGMVFCAVKVFGTHAHRLSFDQSKIPRRPSFKWFVCHGNYVITATAALVRRDELIEIGLFDPRYTTSDDFDAWLKILDRRPIVFLPEQLASYRLHSLNINYGVDRLNDTGLLLRVILRHWWRAPVREKLSLLPRLSRKILGRPYYYIFRRRYFRD